MTKPTILAADDSVTVRKLIEISLRQEDYDLHFAVDGQECLTKANGLQPDLILLDYILPDMKGMEVCQALLASPKTKQVPVLLISGNGAAIRQTYESAGNVADYLTKPFAPNVLNAVVSHLVAKGRSQPAAAPAASELVSAAVEAVTGESTTPVSDQLRTQVNAGVTAMLSPALMAFPALEALREEEPPEIYFLNYLRTTGAVGKLCEALIGLPELRPAPALLRYPSELVPLDRTLTHLGQSRASGKLCVELPEEMIHAHLEAGEIVFITSNNPKRYCAGASFNFRALPQPAIAAAVGAQQKTATPFFITLQRNSALPAGTNLPGLLRAQGEATLARALKAASATITLEGVDKLPADLAPFRLRYSLPALLLAAYRSIDNWLIIESIIPDFDIVLARNADASHLGAQLTLQPGESKLLSLIDGKRPVQELVTLSGQPPYQVARLLFPLVRLGLLTPAGKSSSKAEEPSAVSAARSSAPRTGLQPASGAAQSF